ncbi:MAG: signal peptidase I [Parcubacteria group bacterium]
MLKKIVSTTVVVLFLAIAGLVLLSSLQIPGIPKALVVQTGSMEPAIKTGSVVFVSPTDVYKEGDVITFKRAGSSLDAPVTHRIVGVKAEEGEYVFITKGDANNVEDIAEVRQSEVLGKVIFNIPYVGWVLDFAKKPLGFATFIGIPAVFVISDETRKIIKEIKKKKNEAKKEEE